MLRRGGFRDRLSSDLFSLALTNLA